MQEEEHEIEGLPKDGYCRSKANLSAKVMRFLKILKELLDIEFSIRMKLSAMPITPDSMFSKPMETTISLVILFGKEVLMFQVAVANASL